MLLLAVAVQRLLSNGAKLGWTCSLGAAPKDEFLNSFTAPATKLLLLRPPIFIDSHKQHSNFVAAASMMVFVAAGTMGGTTVSPTA
jgi:hypothetical protein